MARKRMLDPTIWADEDFGTLTYQAMVMYIGIMSNADDEGRLPGNALYLSSIVYPWKELNKKDSLKIRNEILRKMKSVLLYEVDGKEYIQLKNWTKYQKINRPSESKYPPFTERSVNDHGTFTPNRIEMNGIEENRIEKNNGNFSNSPLSEALNKKKKDLEMKPTRTGITKEWQDKAFRHAEYLKISLSEDLKKRWLSFYKKNPGTKTDATVSYLTDYEPFLRLSSDEAKVKYYFAVFYKRI